MLIVVPDEDYDLQGDSDAGFHSEFLEEEPEFNLDHLKKVGLSAILKYSDDQARDERGRWTSGGSSSPSGKTDISGYPDDAKQISSEMRMAQASYRDISANMEEKLAGIRKDSSTYRLKDVEGQLSSDNAKTIISNAKMELSQYSNYLAGDTNNKMRDFIDHMQNVLGARGLESLGAKTVNEFAIDCVRKMIYQEVESNRQQFTDHGIRHIEGNIMRMDAIMRAATDGHADAMDRLMGIAVMVNHDVGYTTPLIRDGGSRAVGVAGDHTAFSEKIYGEQRSLWNEGKMFSQSEYDRALDIIKTHDSTTVSMQDVLGTSVRMSDNLSLFASEKLPGMFQYVKNGEAHLTELGRHAADRQKSIDAGDMVAAKKAEQAFESARNTLHTAIDKANISSQLKRDLKASVREVSYLTPKFTLGVLAGSIRGISKEEGRVVVNVQYSKFDAFLQKHFDMGQRQTTKFLKDYGHTDFNKTVYDIGDFARIKVSGVVTKDIGISAIFKYSEDQPRDYHGRFDHVEGRGGDAKQDREPKASGVGKRGDAAAVRARYANAEKNARIARAKESHIPVTPAKKKIATDNELAVAASIRGSMHIGGTKPFDIHIGIPVKHVIEVKTIIDGKNDKITQHPDSIQRKEELLATMPKRVQSHTIAFDERTGKVYYKAGHGSYRLTAMQDLGNKRSALRKLNNIILKVR